jgi:hypothetical protein
MNFVLPIIKIGVFAATVSGLTILNKDYRQEHVRQCNVKPLVYDVAIIGGGSAGTYTAIQLQKAGKNVAVIERQNSLGGHVDTFVDPVTNRTMDYGVISYVNITTAREYFAYLGVPTQPYTGFIENATSLWAEFASSTAIRYGRSLESQNETAEVDEYAAFEMQPGYHAWTGSTGYTYLPDPVPEELLIPFGQWLQTHDFPAIAYQEWYQGAGNVLNQMTLYMLKYINQDYHNGRLIIGQHENQLLYNTAYARLQASGGTSKVFLNSEPTQVVRNATGVEITFKDPQSACNIIHARQLVLAIPPLYEDLKGFLDMHAGESSLFSRFVNITYWAALLQDTGIAARTGISNIDPKGQANIPGFPGDEGITSGNLGITPSSIADRDLHATWWVGQQRYTAEEVARLLLESSGNASAAFGFQPPEGKSMSVAALTSHTPYLMTVSEEDIRNGFYKNLTALQGQRNTWYTGSAWESESSSAIWNYTLHQVLPGVLARLDHDI